MLYNSLDENFIKKIVQLYYVPKHKAVYIKEIRETLSFISNVNRFAIIVVLFVIKFDFSCCKLLKMLLVNQKPL